MGLARLALGPFPWDGTRGPSGSSGRWDMAGISTEFFDDYGPLKKWPPHAQLIHWELKCLSHNHSSRTDGPRLGIGHAWAIRFFWFFGPLFVHQNHTCGYSRGQPFRAYSMPAAAMMTMFIAPRIEYHGVSPIHTSEDIKKYVSIDFWFFMLN